MGTPEQALSRIRRWRRPLPNWQGVRWLFPRLLAAIYFIAFASWGIQYRGLAGEQGIVPVERLIQNIKDYEEREGEPLWWDYPTLLRLDSSDTFALGLIGFCCVLAVLVLAGVWQRWLLGFLWLGYLSFVVTGDVFMGFQWDALLLEAGLLAVWLAPGRWWTGCAPAPPPRGSVFLLHWLTFRLMWMSGFVKIAGGDAVWEDMTALTFHYETQPLPNPLSWWMHHWPLELHMASCRAMFGVELILPFVMWLGRWGRLLACLGFAALMVAVMLTGNYNFFHLITIALALTLLDDSWWPRRIKRWLKMDVVKEVPSLAAPVLWLWVRRSLAGLTVAAVVLLTTLAADSFLSMRIPGLSRRLPDAWHAHLLRRVQPLRSFNAYGLFQDMTEERPEIVIEVSDDGILWLPLEFRWKPGRLDRVPGQVAPHQPRLDWQMWFAALYPGFQPQRDAQPASPLFWFGEFLGALLQHKQPVWDLLEPPPFPVESIRHVRARLFRYRFTSREVRDQTGNCWQRESLGMFAPALSIRR